MQLISIYYCFNHNICFVIFQEFSQITYQSSQTIICVYHVSFPEIKTYLFSISIVMGSIDKGKAKVLCIKDEFLLSCY